MKKISIYTIVSFTYDYINISFFFKFVPKDHFMRCIMHAIVYYIINEVIL